jgi:DNA polymerase-3 subunit epsilon
MIPGRLAFLDVETTGADPRHDRITEVGLVLVDDGTLIEEWSTLVNPERGIPAGIETLTGITGAMVEQAPHFADIAPALTARLSGRLLVAHNARFDCAFLRNEFRRAGLTFETRALCSVRLSRQLFPEQRQHNLDVLIERFGLACETRHRALPDARLVYRFALEMGRCFDAAALDAAMQAASAKPRLPAWLDESMADDLPDLPGVYVLYDPEGQPLYAGKAANLRSQVLSHFAERARASREQRAALLAGSIDWTPTAGELGAALRHLRLVDTLAPRHNRRPRNGREAWALSWDPQGDPGKPLGTVDLNEVHEDRIGELFGPFASRANALAALRGLTREHGLCPRLAGLEPGTGACSQQPQGLCRGACIGRESAAAHMLRLAQALVRLRIAEWPFPGPAGLLERDAECTRSELHVVRGWRYVGSARTPDDAAEVVEQAHRPPPFDVEVYRVLRSALQGERRCKAIDLSGGLSAWPA